jgi:hypothetical protein
VCSHVCPVIIFGRHEWLPRPLVCLCDAIPYYILDNHPDQVCAYYVP